MEPSHEIVEIRIHDATTVFRPRIVGYGVFNRKNNQLESVHALTWEEAAEMLESQQEAALIRENWPEPDDSEVVALLNDETFKPEGQINVDVLTSPVYRLHMAAETIARRRAGLGPTQNHLEGSISDE